MLFSLIMMKWEYQASTAAKAALFASVQPIHDNFCELHRQDVLIITSGANLCGPNHPSSDHACLSTLLSPSCG
jgi:hypothetical protein